MYVSLMPKFSITKYLIKQKELYLLITKEKSIKSKNPRNSTYVINDIAAEILLKFDGTRTYEEILLYFSEKYKEEREEVRKKIETLLCTLKEKYGFVQIEQEKKERQELLYTEYDNIYPTVVSLEVTNRCNLYCRHCYGGYGFENKNEIPRDRLKKLFQDFKEIGIMTVEITGGDPSVYPYTAEAIHYAFAAGINSVILLTNGVKISKPIFEALYKYRKQMVIQIDLHSLNEEYYDWFTNSKGHLSMVKENIELMVRNNIPIRVVSIITPQNYKELEDIAEWCHERKVPFFATSVVTELGRAKIKNREKLIFQNDKQLLEYLDTYKSIEKKYPGFIRSVEEEKVEGTSCSALFSQVSINPKGEIKLCTMDTGEYYAFKFGNVFEKTIKEIYDENSEFLYSFMNLEYPEANTICKGCGNALFCHRCYLRGLIQAKNLGDKCKWFSKYKESIINQKFNIV